MIGVIDYNMGNIQSVVNAFGHLGEPVTVVRDISKLTQVDRIVLPGVGAFGMGMKNLRDLNMVEALNEEVIKNRKPFLGICLGMQLACKESFEFGHFYGLGWIDASVRKFESDLGVRIPHIGWNNLIIKKDNKLIENNNNQDVYFVHSYYVDAIDRSIVAATCEYGREFIASIEKDNIFATQFHPEKSQGTGLGILKKFAEVDLECLKDV